MNHELWCCSLRIGMMKKMVNGLPQPFQIPSTRDRGSKRFAWPVTSFEFYLCECNAIVFKEAIFWWQKIKNPNYQGKWKAPKIDNPGDTLLSFSQMILICWGNFFFYCISLVQCMKNNLTFVIDYKDDPDLYVFPDLKYVAIELWQVISSRLIYVWHFFFYNYWNISTVQNSFMYQVKSGTLFDNVLICDDPEYAKKFAEETWGKQKDVWMWTSFGLSDQCSVSTWL